MMLQLLQRLAGRRRRDLPAGDSLDAFSSETGRASKNGSSRFSPRGLKRWHVATLAVIVCVASAGYVNKGREFFRVQAAAASLTIESDPPGADVLVSGTSRGRTPLRLSLSPGQYAVELVHEGRRRPVTVVARSGADVFHHVQFDSALSPEPERSANSRDPARRAAPVNRPSAAAPAGPAAGWLSVQSPIELRILEGSDVIGTTASPRILLTAGRRSLRLVNVALGFSATEQVRILAGQTASIRVKVPQAPVSINAVPWAEVLVDGNVVGETPIGNHMVPIGRHEVTFRHPELGERRQTVTVSLTTPARVSMDMRNRQP